MISYDDYRNRIIAAQEQWNRERENIYDFTHRLDDGFRGEFDPPLIPGPDNYDTMTLAQMVSAVDAMRPGIARSASDAWLNISMNLGGAIDTFNKEFARTVTGDGKHSGWTGHAAASAVSAVNGYSEQSQGLARAASLVSFKLAELHTGLNQTQALMPEATQRPDLQGKTLPQDGVMKAGDYTEEEATQEARRVLRTVYGQVANQTDQGVPVLPAAPTIADNPPSPVVPPKTPPDVPNSVKPQGSSGSDDSSQTGNSPEQTPATNPAGTGSTPQSTTPASANSQSSTPASTPNASPTTPASTPTPRTPNLTPSGPARPIGIGTGSPSRSSSPSTPGIPRTPGTPAGPGRSIPGGSQQPTATPAVAAATRSDNPAGRAGGMQGMSPGAAGKGKDDERESSGVKDFLISQKNGDELTGLDSLEQPVQPVIGGDKRNG